MYVPRASAPVFFTALLLCCAAAPAAAQNPAPAQSPTAAMHATKPVPHANQIIKVSHCHPSLNLMQSGGYYGGFTPGFPGYYGAGYWGDVYGARFYQPPVTTASPQLAIDYVNVSHDVMRQIEFGLVANGVLVAEVKDVGTFSPGAEIKHRFSISANVFPIQTGLPQCVPMHVVYESGAKWRNPALPPKNQHIYYHP